MNHLQVSSNSGVIKKNTGAIHIKNDISCLQRKVWNVLLKNAYEELSDTRIATHHIRVRDLCELAGFDSKNISYLKEALEDMVTTKLTWNIIDESGKSEWGVSAALASAVIRDGICSYSYSHHLREKLYNPEFYAKIDIFILRRFASGHALALYENCVRYLGVRQSPAWSLEIVRDLLGVGSNASYNDFKVLNRAVIKPAIQEINTVSDIHIAVEMMREKRKVVGVKFLIESSAQEALQIEAPQFNDELLKELQDKFCLTEIQAKEILAMHSEDKVHRVMNYVEGQYLAGSVRKIAPYFLKVIKDGDVNLGESAIEKKKKDDANQASKEQQKRAEFDDKIRKFKSSRRERLVAHVGSMDQETFEALKAEFELHLKQTNLTILPYWKKHGMESKLAANAFYAFAEKKYLPDESDDLKQFMQTMEGATA